MNELTRGWKLINITECPFSGQTEWQKEQRLWMFAYELLNQSGLRPKSEDLEDFVERHLDTIVVG